MAEREGRSSGLFMVGIAAVFLAGFFLLVIFGAQCYRGAVSGQRGNMDRRALESYIATVVKGSDRAGAVSVRSDDSVGTELIILDDAGYALRIYAFGGQLLEEYARPEAAPAPERAQVIGETAVFAATLEDGLLSVTTDAGEALVYLRAGGDAA